AVPLAEAELALVVALVRASGRTRTRRGLVLEAPRWHDAVAWELSESDVDLHIEQIRAKLGDDARQLRFVRGAGYQLGRVSLFA
ncbi:MAG: winged helix-turn-helix domain-containing protein, partial [Myxococcota bacterium]